MLCAAVILPPNSTTHFPAHALDACGQTQIRGRVSCRGFGHSRDALGACAQVTLCRPCVGARGSLSVASRCTRSVLRYFSIWRDTVLIDGQLAQQAFVDRLRERRSYSGRRLDGCTLAVLCAPQHRLKGTREPWVQASSVWWLVHCSRLLHTICA